MSQVQANMGIFIKVMPGARMFRMVTMMLIEPMMDEAPRMCMAKIPASIEGPICRVKGAYRVQPAAGAPPGMKNEPTSMRAAGIISQKLKLFMRAKAMSDAPICKGSIQFANPTKAGMMAPNTMMMPCMVVNWLNNSGLTTCSPGWNNSARMPRAKTPPTMSMAKLNSRYRVPMSLWLVAYTQRRQPAGA